MKIEDLELSDNDLLMEIPEEMLGEDDTINNDIVEEDDDEVETIEKNTTPINKDDINLNTLEIPEEEDETAEEVNPFLILAEDMKENSDMLASIDNERLKEVSSLAEFRDLLVEDLNTAKQEWIDSLNNNAKGLLTHIQNGGKVEDFIDVYAEDNYSDLTKDKIENDEKLQEKLILDLYKEQGYSSDKAKRKLDRIIDKEEEALDAHEELIKIKEGKKKQLEETTKKEAEIKKQQYDSMWKTIEDNTNKVEEFLPGKKVDKRIKESVFKSINDVWSEVINNPAKYAHTLAYLKHYKILDGDFTKIEIDATSKATKNLGKILEKGSKATSVVDKDDEIKNAIRHSILGNKKTRK